MFGKRKEERERRPGLKIVIAAGCRGCGVSFVTEVLAEGLTKNGSVSVSETGDAHFYDALGFEKAFLARGYTDYFAKLRANEHVGAADANSFDDINWIARCPGDNDALSSAGLFRLLYTPKDEYNIFDCSGLDEENTLALLAEADFPVCVIDPLPSRISKSRDFLERVLVAMPDCTIIVNKMNPGVHGSEIKRFLGSHEYFSITSVPQEYIYKAEYNSISFCKLPACREILGKTQDMLCRVFN